MPHLLSPTSVFTLRLELVVITPDYLTTLFQSKSKDEIISALFIRSESEFETEKKRFEEGYQSFNRSFVLFKILDRSTRRILGQIGYHTWIIQHHRAEVGYEIFAESDKRKAYMSEAMAAVLEFGFEQMRLHRIEALIGTQNTGSKRLTQSFGFRYEGVMKEHYLRNGVYEDSEVYALLKAQFDLLKGIVFRKSKKDDWEGIYALYQKVSRRTGGLARQQDEITIEYVQSFCQNALERGLQWVAIDTTKHPEEMIAEIHTYRPGIKVFDHVFSELTIAVTDEYQGKGIGKRMFSELLHEIQHRHFDIARVELIARESNKQAISLYERLGFVKEGKLNGRIKNSDGTTEADIPMAWANPSYVKK